MLTNIENRLEELFESIETMPPEKVEAAEKVSHNLYWFSNVWLIIWENRGILKFSSEYGPRVKNIILCR